MKPNKPLIRKWVAALRSRKYKQCIGALRETDSANKPLHCCLGVLCEEINIKRAPGNSGYNTPDGSFFNGGLHEIVLNKVGIDNQTQSELMTMNDDKGKKFYQIANYLEKKFLS